METKVVGNKITNIDRQAIERDFAVLRMKYFICPDGNTRRLQAFEINNDSLVLEFASFGNQATGAEYVWHLSEVEKKFRQFTQIPREQAEAEAGPQPAKIADSKSVLPANVLPSEKTPAVVEVKKSAEVATTETETSTQLSQLDSSARSLVAWGEEIAPTQKLQEGLMEIFDKVRSTPTDRNLTQAKTAVDIVGKMIDVNKVRIDAIRLAKDLQSPRK